MHESHPTNTNLSHVNKQEPPKQAKFADINISSEVNKPSSKSIEVSNSEPLNDLLVDKDEIIKATSIELSIAKDTIFQLQSRLNSIGLPSIPNSTVNKNDFVNKTINPSNRSIGIETNLQSVTGSTIVEHSTDKSNLELSKFEMELKIQKQNNQR